MERGGFSGFIIHFQQIPQIVSPYNFLQIMTSVLEHLYLFETVSFYISIAVSLWATTGERQFITELTSEGTEDSSTKYQHSNETLLERHISCKKVLNDLHFQKLSKYFEEKFLIIHAVCFWKFMLILS